MFISDNSSFIFHMNMYTIQIDLTSGGTASDSPASTYCTTYYICQLPHTTYATYHIAYIPYMPARHVDVT